MSHPPSPAQTSPFVALREQKNNNDRSVATDIAASLQLLADSLAHCNQHMERLDAQKMRIEELVSQIRASMDLAQDQIEIDSRVISLLATSFHTAPEGITLSPKGKKARVTEE